MADPRPVIIAGFVVIAVTFGGFGIWAGLAPLARGAYAPGTLAVEGKRKTVQHLEGGIVREILVQEGDKVEKDQPLIRLDRTQIEAQHGLFSARRDQELALVARLTAERDGAAEIEFPEELMRWSTVPRVASTIQDQKSLFAARRRELVSQVEILEQRVVQLRRQIDGLQAEQKANREQVALIADELAGVRALHAKGYAPLTRVRALERSASALEGDFGSRTAQIAQAEVRIGETRMEIVQSEQRFRRAVLDELRDARARFNDLGEQVLAARDTLDRIEIRAPLAGQVVGLAVHTIGGVVSPREKILDIVPTGDRLIVEARVSLIDAELVHPGLSARIRFPGLPRRTAPLIHGEVKTVSADAIRDPQSPISYYLARIAVSEQEFDKLQDATLAPGMPADVLIETGTRTVLGYLAAPWADLFEKAMRED